MSPDSRDQDLKVLPESVVEEKFVSYQVPEILGGKYDNKTGLQSALYWDPKDDQFHIQFNIGKADAGRAKKKLKETIRDSKYFEKYRDLLVNKEISEDETPTTVLHLFGGDQKTKQELEQYFHELMAMPAKKLRKELMRQPKNWRKRLLYTGISPLAFGMGFFLADYLFKTGQLIQEWIKPLQDARDYLDTASQSVLGIKQSAIGLGSILQPLSNIAADRLADTANGMVYHWDDGVSETIIVPDANGDGIPDIYPDGQGGWSYNYMSEPAQIHQLVMQGSTDPAYRNIAKILEQYCLNYQAYKDLTNGLQSAINTTNSISGAASIAQMNIANADLKIAGVLGQMGASASSASVYSATERSGLKDRIEYWAAEHPKTAVALKISGNLAMIPVSFVVPLAGLGYFFYRVVKILKKERREYNEFQQEYKPVLKLDGQMTTPRMVNEGDLKGPLPVYEEVFKRYREGLPEASAAA